MFCSGKGLASMASGYFAAEEFTARRFAFCLWRLFVGQYRTCFTLATGNAERKSRSKMVPELRSGLGSELGSEFGRCMPKQLTVVMAQLNLLVGDIKCNTDRVIAAARESIVAFGADIVAFPELTLTGYPPEDLLLRPSLAIRVNKALQRLLDADLDVHMIVGHPLRNGAQLYNALSLIKGRNVLATYRKQ